MLEITHKMNYINLALIFTAFSHLDSCNSLNYNNELQAWEIKVVVATFMSWM